MMKFGKGEVLKVKKLFHLLSPDGFNLFPPDCKELPADSKSRGLYVEFKGDRMEMDYAIWDRFSSAWATIFAQELTRHFQVTKAGWDSIGYLKGISQFKQCQGFPIFGNNVIDKNALAWCSYGLTLNKTLLLEKRWKKQAEELVSDTIVRLSTV